MKTSIDALRELVDLNPELKEVMVTYYVDNPGSASANPRVNSWVPLRPISTFNKRAKALNRALIAEDDQDWTWSVTNKVVDEYGHVRYYAVMDFRSPAGEGYDEVNEALLKTILPHAEYAKPGYVIMSGRSYHYFGLSLFSHDEWLNFLGLALLCEDGGDKLTRYSPIDRRWLGHTLRRGWGSLRFISWNGKPVPEIVSRID